MFFQHPGFSQHPRCFISTCGVFPAPEKECFCSIRKVFFEDQVFSPHPEVFFQHQRMSVFSAPSWYFLSIKVFSPHPRCFFSTPAVVFSQLQNGVFPAPEVFFQHPNGVFCAKWGFFSTATVFFERRQKRDTETDTETETVTETKTDT